MKFTQHCFIRKNTPELREHLRQIGLRQNCFDDNKGEWLAVNYGLFISVSEGFERLHKDDIDCGTNEEMFLALAALNDSNDLKQWYVDLRFPDDTYYLSYSLHINILHKKLSAKEIVKHFSLVEKLAKVGLRRGHLSCYDCIHNYECENNDKRCEANGLYENQIWHKIDKENSFYKRNRLGKDGRILWS